MGSTIPVARREPLPMKRPRSGGGWPAIAYAWHKSRQAGGILKMWRALRSRNACKTCALGMGGQRGGMVNEAGRRFEVCKKSIQAMAADMQGAIGPEFWHTYSVPQLQTLSPRELEACGRIVQPLVCARDSDHFRPIAWDEALQRIAGKLRSLAPDETFWYFSGRSSNEAGFLLQLFARIYGTNNVNNCSYYCHQASGVGLTSAIGSGTATIVLDDIEHADLVFVIGGNPASNHPRLMKTLMQVRRRRGDVVVINPAVEVGLVNFRVPSDLRSLLFGSRIASLYVQPHIGGDLALLYGIAKRIDEMGAIDEHFLRDHCSGWDELARYLRRLSWADIHARCGVPQRDIDALAEAYARSQRTVFAWTMGITHHAHGVANVQAIANLALMRGMVGKPHAGLLPIRGHSNVQGMGSVGVTPQLKRAVYQRLREHFGLELPRQRGLDTLGCIEAAADGRLRMGFCLGGNLYGSNPDSAFARHALSRLEMLVYLSTTLNTGHVHPRAGETLILPVLARDEEPQPTTQESMFNYVRLSEGGIHRLDGPRSEVEVIADLAHRVLGDGGPLDWKLMQSHRRIREAMARILPGFEALAHIDDTRQEFHIAGRTFHEPRFATESGRAQLHVHELPPLEGTLPGELRLMTVRSEGQFNTVVYEEYDLYRGQERRDVILMHPDDMARLNVHAEQRVTVRSATGSLAGILVREYPYIKPGNAIMYYPEANALVPRVVDPQSRTPAFKNVVVRIEVGTPVAVS
jgi:molybdopterin-dependent oxidoreductase alpha subunit